MCYIEVSVGDILNFLALNKYCVENQAMLYSEKLSFFTQAGSKKLLPLILQHSTKERKLGPEALDWTS